MDISKSMLARDLGTHVGISSGQAEKFLDALLGLIKENVTVGDKVNIRGFGSFTAKTSKDRMGRNPSTGEAVHIPASTTLKFKAYGKL